MNMRGANDLVMIAIVLILIALSVSCGIARFNECNRVHPFWYCVSQ